MSDANEPKPSTSLQEIYDRVVSSAQESAYRLVHTNVDSPEFRSSGIARLRVENDLGNALDLQIVKMGDLGTFHVSYGLVGGHRPTTVSVGRTMEDSHINLRPEEITSELIKKILLKTMEKSLAAVGHVGAEREKKAKRPRLRFDR